MRHPLLLTAGLLAAAVTAGCAQNGEEAVQRAFQDVNVIEESDLSDVMLTVADPDEAVTYFTRSTKENPDRIDLQRGLAQSLVRARRVTEAVPAWRRVTEMEGAGPNDSVQYADTLIRANEWETAEAVLDAIPPTHETFERYRLEAMVADANKDWTRADSFYETAMGLTTRTAGVLNNWGYSKLTRGDFAEAERLFGEAVRQDDRMFTAKNNLILARGAQRNYALPVIPMTQSERAQLLHTLALSAVKQGDVATGKNLLRDAIETHPQHFEEAVRSLDALEAS